MHTPLRIAGLASAMVLLTVWPFLPGAYDALAVPLSTMTQAAGVTGLLLVPIGLGWLAARRPGPGGHPLTARDFGFALAASVAGMVVVLVVVLVALATVGPSLALPLGVLSLVGAWRAVRGLRAIRAGERSVAPHAPYYLVALPAVALVLQLTLAAPLTTFSRGHAMASSATFIRDIEAYHARHGSYPVSLAAMWKDYDPDVVGVEKFHYARAGDAYHLFFEQPRFLFDRIGTREWVVYNSADDQRMYSHTSWLLLLPPAQLERSQGWYDVHDAGVPHWKFFWFD